MAEPLSAPATSSAEATDPFVDWCQALEARHLRELAFPEVRRALAALSALYVGRGHKLEKGAALDGAGKRAAFAWFYGALHFLTARLVARELGLGTTPCQRIVELGCGTGAAGAALALEYAIRPLLLGVDINRWATLEARWTWSHFGLQGSTQVGDLLAAARGGRETTLLAAYAVNELAPGARQELWQRLSTAARAGARVLVIEPIAHGPIPWWSEWAARVVAQGGRVDEWSFPAELPPRLRLLDKAAGLHHTRIKARSLYLA